MKWERKSKYHEESVPPRFYLAACKDKDGWTFTLTDGETLVMVGTAEDCKAEAARLDKRAA